MLTQLPVHVFDEQGEGGGGGVLTQLPVHVFGEWEVLTQFFVLLSKAQPLFDESEVTRKVCGFCLGGRCRIFV